MIQKTKKIGKGSSPQAIFFPTLIGILVLLVISLLIFSNLKISQKRTELISQIEALKEKIQILEEKNVKMRKEISQVGSEGYLEKEARERLGLKKPGEEVVVILPLAEKKEKVEEQKSFWQRFLDSVRNFFRDL